MKLNFNYINKNVINRDKWVIEKLRKIPSGESILDAGAGEQKYKKYCDHLKYTSQDFCQYKGFAEFGTGKDEKWNTDKIDIICDITSIPLEDQSIENIICTEVFEHIKNPNLALMEFARLLKPNGKLILTAPFASFTHMAPYHYCTGFSKFWYEETLKDNSFEIIEITPNGNWFSYVGQEATRANYMSKEFSKRPMGIIGKAITFLFAKLMDYYSKINKNSEEVAVFGYQVVAIKK